MFDTFDYHLIVSHIRVPVCLLNSMLCCVLCYFIIFPVKENIVTKTAIGKECLTALYLNCGGNLTGKKIKIKIISTWRRKRSIRHPCYNINLV